MEHSHKWERRFLELAEHISTWSRDPSTKVGAVIVDAERRVLGMGYNGLPRGVLDTVERLTNRELKYPMTIHAEVNAIHNARGDVRGSTIYVHPLPTCARCAGQIIQAGITRVVCRPPVSDGTRPWSDEFNLSLQMYEEAGVSVSLLQP